MIFQQIFTCKSQNCNDLLLHRNRGSPQCQVSEHQVVEDCILRWSAVVRRAAAMDGKATFLIERARGHVGFTDFEEDAPNISTADGVDQRANQCRSEAAPLADFSYNNIL